MKIITIIIIGILLGVVIHLTVTEISNPIPKSEFLVIDDDIKFDNVVGNLDFILNAFYSIHDNETAPIIISEKEYKELKNG